MTPFRDGQVALMERVARLEDELREAREAAARPQVETPSETPAEPAPAGNPLRALAFVTVATLIGALGLVWQQQRATAPTVTKPGDPTSVAEARATATKAGLPASGRLLTMKAYYVSSDGTLHSHPAYSPRVEYTFAAPPTPEPVSSIPRPIGAPPAPTMLLQNEYKVTLTPYDTQVEPTLMLGLHGPVVDPHCRLVDVWKTAETAGAPAEAVAVIEYSEGMVEARGRRGNLSRVPHWHFEIATTPPFKVDVSDNDCSVIR